jgi:hypothetical protein
LSAEPRRHLSFWMISSEKRLITAATRQCRILAPNLSKMAFCIKLTSKAYCWLMNSMVYREYGILAENLSKRRKGSLSVSISFHDGTILTINKGERCIHLCEPVRAWNTDSTITTIHVQQVRASRSWR